jgi:hypothetical protein
VLPGSFKRPATTTQGQKTGVPESCKYGVGLMKNRIKTLSPALLIISVGGILIYSALKLRQVLGADLSTILFFLGAIVLSIGLTVFDIKNNKNVKSGVEKVEA